MASSSQPPTEFAKYTTTKIPSRNDPKTELAVYQWSVPQEDEPPKAELLIVHGYLEHALRYQEVATYLTTQCQINVIAYDIRGHGQSSGKRAYVNVWDDYWNDLESVFAHVFPSSEANNNNNQKKVPPRFVLGHSNGGLQVLSYYLLRNQQQQQQQQQQDTNIMKHVNGVIITSPWLAPAEKLPWIKVQASKLLGHSYSLLKTLSIPVDQKELSGDVLTHDTKLAKEHDDDPLNLHYVTASWAYQSMKMQTIVQQQLKFWDTQALPLLYVYASDDKVACPETNKKFIQLLMCNDTNEKTILERKDAYHEILNETDRYDLFAILKQWILKHT